MSASTSAVLSMSASNTDQRVASILTGPDAKEEKKANRTNDYTTLLATDSGATAGYDAKEDTVTVDYKETAPTNFPIDRKKAFLMRIGSFAAGAKLAVPDTAEQAEETKKLISMHRRIDDLVTKYEGYLALDKIQNPQSLEINTYTVELYKFQQDLCALTGLSAKDLALAEAMHVWQHEEPPTHVTIFKSGEYTIKQVDSPVKAKLTDFQKRELLKIFGREKPIWFTKLPVWAQDFIKNDILVSKDNPHWDNYEKNIPATLRKILGQANATKHELFISLGKIELSHTTSYRQGVPTSFEMSSAEDRQASATGNLEQMLTYACTQDAKNAFYTHWGIAADEQKAYACPVFVGGLLTHSKQAYGVYNLFEGSRLGNENNSKMVDEQQVAFNKFLENPPAGFQFYNLNIAVNKQRDIDVVGMERKEDDFLNHVRGLHARLQHKLCSDQDGKNLAQLSQSLRRDKNLSAPLHHLLHLTDVLRAVEATRRTNPQSGRNKNLFLAAQYELLVRASGGISLKNCKSSKDRAGVAIMMADAMEIYYRENNDYPKYNDTPENRAKFIKIFKELYASGHQQFEANYNSPGAAGIKDEGILDKDIKDALGDLYGYSVELGELNKPGTFFQKNASIFNKLFLGVGIALALITGSLAATGTFAPFTGLSTAPAAAFFINFGLALGMVGLLYLTIRLIDKFFPSDATFANQQDNVKKPTKLGRAKKLALGFGALIGLGLGFAAFFAMPNLAATVMAQLGIYSVLFSGLIFGAVGYGLGALISRNKASYIALLGGLFAMGTGLYLASAGIIPTVYAATALTILAPVLPCILVTMLITNAVTSKQSTLGSVSFSNEPNKIITFTRNSYLNSLSTNYSLSASVSQNASMSAEAEAADSTSIHPVSSTAQPSSEEGLHSHLS